MIEFYLQYQAIYFARLADITPRTRDLANLLTAFVDKEFITGTAQEVVATASAGGLQNRIRLTNPDGDLSVLIGSNRLDVTCSAKGPDSLAIQPLRDFVSLNNEIVERITKLYPRQANRLALTSKALCVAMDNTRITELYFRLVKPSQFYKDNAPYEWSVRNVSKRNVTINGSEESLNVILTVARVQGGMQLKGMTEEFDRIAIDVDINTVPSNERPRFDSSNINEFYQQAAAIHNDISNEIVAFLS